jgi:lycopene beta-cyclase
MLDEPALSGKKILLVDRQVKNLNDRTWCFWESGEGYFESIIHHTWSHLWVKHPEGKVPLDMGDYHYKMIRGLDFYKSCFSRINRADNIEVLYGEVTDVQTDEGTIKVNGQEFKAERIFSSSLIEPPVLKPDELYLLQHFKGWWIETAEDFFDDSDADLMNFCTSQVHGCTFLYVLPVSKRRALVEYTLFTEEPLTSDQYDEGLKEFIKNELGLTDYKITETEQGVIPMTNMRFPEKKGKITFIGTAGGQTKPSTGYTFQFIQKHAVQLVESLVKGTAIKQTPKRFHFYDSVLLRVLHERKEPGADVFYKLFKKNKASGILRFLDNESTIMDEIGVMNATNRLLFFKAAIRK